jgi:hypothetical protein
MTLNTDISFFHNASTNEPLNGVRQVKGSILLAVYLWHGDDWQVALPDHPFRCTAD